MLPFCPFVRGHGAKHSAQYLDLGPRDLREHRDGKVVRFERGLNLEAVLEAAGLPHRSLD